ncbi:hypothetical protein MSG28_008881 [Choristoneura fumiferana]|uniref:Uncharacterized protein n=1 Tax=Choristoneura fumiferana TaxID=7141 RepID=A0ACC0J8B9_CHOFU|nr:hypothetical protein MSG28_008881 [Choristoneura fumiferana]
MPSSQRSCQGRYQLSLEAYLEADKLTKYPDSDIYCALAECAWNLGQLERGVEWARSAVQAGGGERASAVLARLLLAVGDLRGASAAYDQAIATHACGADTLAAAGALRLRAGDPRQAFQLLGAALAQQPAQHAAALALAAMMLQHRDLDAALARLKGALSAHPTCVAAHTNLGLALLAKKKYVAALTCLQRAVWSAPLSARAAHNLGLALLLCRRPASAFCRLATAAALQPHQPYTVLLIGIALERLGDARADAAYARAAALEPGNALVRLNRAGRLARAGNIAQAVEEARATAELLQRDEKPDAQLASSLDTLLALLREAGLNASDLPDTLPLAKVATANEVEDEELTADEYKADSKESSSYEDTSYYNTTTKGGIASMERNNLTEQEYYELVRDQNIDNDYDNDYNNTKEPLEDINGSNWEVKTYDETMQLLNDWE